MFLSPSEAFLKWFLINIFRAVLVKMSCFIFSLHFSLPFAPDLTFFSFNLPRKRERERQKRKYITTENYKINIKIWKSIPCFGREEILKPNNKHKCCSREQTESNGRNSGKSKQEECIKSENSLIVAHVWDQCKNQHRTFSTIWQWTPSLLEHPPVSLWDYLAQSSAMRTAGIHTSRTVDPSESSWTHAEAVWW